MMHLLQDWILIFLAFVNAKELPNRFGSISPLDDKLLTPPACRNKDLMEGKW
jgi:hypothetical protein